MGTIYLYSYELPDGEKAHTYEHTLGRRLLCRGLKDMFRFETTPDWLNEHIVAQEFKKPFIGDYPQFHYNISHCSGLVVCALSESPVGVDAEHTRNISDSLIRKLMTDEEKAFFLEVASDEDARREWFLRFWTLKESYLKYTGEGLTRALKSVSFTFRHEKASGDGRDWSIACSDPNVVPYQWRLCDDRILSVCTGEKEPFELRHVQFL